MKTAIPMIHRHTLAATVLSALALLAATPAKAELTKSQCIAANTDAQSLRREGKLSQARQKLRACGDPSCPALVSTDCAKRLDELESVQPTLVFEVKDASGRDLTEVRVTVDGQLVREKLDGTATPIDPGARRLVFTVPGVAPLTRQLVIREGEKARVVSVVLDSLGERPSAAAAAPSDTPTTSGEAEPGSAPAEVSNTSSSSLGSSDTQPRPRRTLGYVVTGTGVAGLVVGSVFGYLTLAAKNRQITNCENSENCKDYGAASDAHEDARSSGTISSIAFIAGAAVTTVGIVLIVTAKPGTSEKSSAALALRAHAAPGRVGFGFDGAF